MRLQVEELTRYDLMELRLSHAVDHGKALNVEDILGSEMALGHVTKDLGYPQRLVSLQTA